MNLGIFAGAATDSFRQDRRFDAERQDAADNKQFRERQMKMAEEDQAFQRGERERVQKMRDEQSSILKSAYGDHEVEDGFDEVDNGQGTMIKQPRMKMVTRRMGDDPAYDAKVFQQVAQAHVRSTANPEDILKIGQAVDNARRTQNGKVIERVVSGDTAAIPEFAKIVGKDATGAKFIVDPTTHAQKVVWKDGTESDLRKAAYGYANAQLAAELRAQSDDSMKVTESNARIKNLRDDNDRQGRQLKLAEQELPSKIALNQAHARYYEEGRKGSELNRISAIDEKRQKDLSARINSVLPREADMSSDDPKAIWLAPQQWVHGRVAGKLADNPKADQNGVFKAAMDDYTAIKQSVDSVLGKAQEDPQKLNALVKRFRVKPHQLRQRMMEEYLSMNQ